MLNKPKKFFTITELLIIIAIIAILAVAAFILFNPKKQIEKAWDGKRKHELSQLKKVLEDWYNDKNCYPKPSEICFDPPTSKNTCRICGHQSSSPSLSPYLPLLPCDPQYPKKNYLYQVDNLKCPQWYRIYADLSLSDFGINDETTKQLECYSQSCGPAPDYGYDYGVTSNNIDLERSKEFAFCSVTGCNTCSPLNYEECLNRDISYFCQQKKTIYANANICSKNCPCQP